MSDKDIVETAAEANPEIAANPAEPQQNYIKMAVDYGPVIAFGVTFFACSVLKLVPKGDALIWASGVLAAASIVAVIAGLVLEKRVAWIALVSAMIAIPFSILTVVFHNPVFVKVKMTIIDALIGAILMGALALKKQPLKALLGDSLKLKDEAWGPLTLYYALFYFLMAGVNEVVWRTQPDNVWVTWKLGSIIGGPVLLTLCLMPFLLKNMVSSGDETTN